jgi:hypothetical protein
VAAAVCGARVQVRSDAGAGLWGDRRRFERCSVHYSRWWRRLRSVPAPTSRSRHEHGHADPSPAAAARRTLVSGRLRQFAFAGEAAGVSWRPDRQVVAARNAAAVYVVWTLGGYAALRAAYWGSAPAPRYGAAPRALRISRTIYFSISFDFH